VGTLLPLGFETLRAFLGALSLLKMRAPDLFTRLRVHFVGTSNQTMGSLERVFPEARRLGVEEAVHEVPERIDYLDALNVLIRSDAILLMGSSEGHYTASKLFPALLARRPLLAIFHEESSVVDMLRAARRSSLQLVTYGDHSRAESRVEEILASLRGLLDEPRAPVSGDDSRTLAGLSARSMAERLSNFLDSVVLKRTP
jgi:hypothetical protein